MSDETLDPLIHAPARLRIVVTLAALREGDSVSFPRLQRMLDLTPGNLIADTMAIMSSLDPIMGGIDE